MEGIECAVSLWIDPERRPSLAELLGGSPIVNFSAPERQTLRLWLGERASRADVVGEGLLGNDCGFVHREDGGTLWLAHASRAYVSFSSEEVPGKRSAELPSRVSVERGANEADVVVRIRERGRTWTQRLRLSQDPRLLPFARRLVRALYCGPQQGDQGCTFDAIAELGVPTRGEFYEGDLSEGETADPLSRFEILNPRHVTWDNDPFAPPEGYEDLRQMREEGRWPEQGMVPVEPVTVVTGSEWTVGADGKAKAVPPMGSAAVTDTIPRPLPSDPPEEEPPEEEPPEEAPPLTPTGLCLPSTTESVVGALVDQKLLDDIRFIVNVITTRLTTSASSLVTVPDPKTPGATKVIGRLTVPWLNQMRAHATSVGMGPGAGLFCLLRDAPTTANPGGTGILDQLVEISIRKRLRAGAAPDPTALGLAPADVTAISAAGGDYDSIPSATQTRYREAVLATEFARVSFDYDSNTEPKLIFEDLMYVQLQDITLTINFANTPIVDKLEIGSQVLAGVAGGIVKFDLTIPSVSMGAKLDRWGSSKYWWAIFFTAAACAAVPILCPAAGIVAMASLFFTFDKGTVAATAAPLTLKFTIGFAQDKADRLLRPRVKVQAQGSVTASYTSTVPTGVHQVLAFIYTLVANHGRTMLDAIGDNLGRALTELLGHKLGVVFPPAIARTGFDVASSRTIGKPKKHLYLEASVRSAAGALVHPFITDVERWPYVALSRHLTAFKAGSPPPWHYLSFALSQNFLNHYFAGLWAAGAFRHEFGPDDVLHLKKLVPTALPPTAQMVRVTFWAANPPRLQLGPAGAALGLSYMMAFFDDLRLCFADMGLITNEGVPPETTEFRFSARMPAEIGFGKYLDRPDPQPDKLQLLQAAPQLFDLYLDLDGVKVDPEELLDGVTTGAKPVEPASLTGYKPLFETALRLAFAPRDSKVIPRKTDPKDEDPVTRQTYPLDDSDPDASLNRMPLAYIPERGILYVLSQSALLLNLFLDGTFDPTTTTCATGVGWRVQIPKP